MNRRKETQVEPFLKWVGGVHNTKEEAMSTINWSLIYVDTVRINWGE